MTHWISLTDRLPAHGEKCLISAKELVMAARCDRNSYWVDQPFNLDWDCIGWSGYEFDADFADRDVTHWMPLPEPAPIGKP